MNGRLLSLKDKNNLMDILLKEPWPYWVGCLLLAILNIIYFIISGKYWSITTGFLRWGAWLLSLTGIEVESWEVWKYHSYFVPWQDRLTWSNLGIITGALIAILLARQFKWKKIKNRKQIFIGLLGGYLMGYGARVAIGCNIGGLYSALSSLALNGWLFLPFIILGVYLGSKVLLKWLY